jgi:TRAP-type C4-dicarboxylate transport system permease small subunit
VRRARLGVLAGAVFRAAGLFGMAALFAAGAVTVVDVVLRFFGGAVPGAVDLVQLFMMAAVFAAIPFAFFRDGHVSVDLVTRALPPRLQALQSLMTSLLALALMSLIVVYGWKSAAMQVMFGDVSQNLGIPMIWYWAPLIAGSALSILACLIAAGTALRALVSPSPGPRSG